MNAADLQKLSDWLIDGARSAGGSPQMMAEICERLVSAGLPLWRGGVFVRALHPHLLRLHFILRPGARGVTAGPPHSFFGFPDFKNNPVGLRGCLVCRVRLTLSGP